MNSCKSLSEFWSRKDSNDSIGRQSNLSTVDLAVVAQSCGRIERVFAGQSPVPVEDPELTLEPVEGVPDKDEQAHLVIEFQTLDQFQISLY